MLSPLKKMTENVLNVSIPHTSPRSYSNVHRGIISFDNISTSDSIANLTYNVEAEIGYQYFPPPYFRKTLVLN